MQRVSGEPLSFAIVFIDTAACAFPRTRQFCIFAFVLGLALSFAKGQNALSSFFNTSTNQQEVFYIGADQNVYEIWWTLARALDRVLTGPMRPPTPALRATPVGTAFGIWP
jgi:hypothetical protein